MPEMETIASMQSVNAAAFLTIQPAGEEEWVIHNVYHEGAAEIYVVEGALELLFDNGPGEGAWGAYHLHVTNNHYLKVKNTEGSAKLIGYDGVKTK